MHGNLQGPRTETIEASPHSGSESPIAPHSGSYDENWFKNAAKAGLGSDPGLAVHVITGCAPSSGYRYANGERQLTLFMFWMLCRTSQGGTWFRAFLGAVKPKWWVELEWHASIGAKILKAIGEGNEGNLLECPKNGTAPDGKRPVL